MAKTDPLLKLAAELDKESDRALAILAASYLDHLLGCLITTTLGLEGIPKAAHKFLFEGPNAGLADFSARIEMVGHLEIFSKAEIKDLHRIRKIRNEFAHDFTGVSFDAQKVADLCGALKITKDDRGPLTPRECYKRATLQFMITILCQIRSHGEDD